MSSTTTEISSEGMGVPVEASNAVTVSDREHGSILLAPRASTSFKSALVPCRLPTLGEVLKKVRNVGSSFDMSGSKSNSSSFDMSVSGVAMAGPGDKVVDVLDESESMNQSDIRKHPSIVLQFHSLTYTVKQKNSRSAVPGMCQNSAMVNPTQSPPPSTSSRVPLLDQISGEARDGEILAIMGPSGSGKSTLIDALAQRIVPESLAGTITLNGEQVSNSLLKSISAYVMQDDLLFPMLTVEETLMFAAKVRLPSSSHSVARKRERVGQLLLQLGLHGVAHTIIGDEDHRGVSGGERRRVSIGIDIIHDPLLLFLDEPTSGLDSTSAFLVIKTLQKIARAGSIVILTIHQPSYRILGLLDRLIILAFGQKIYGGPPSELNSFYAAFGRPVPEHENSTEHGLDLIQELQSSPTGIQPLVEFLRVWGEGNDGAECGPKSPFGGMDVRGALIASIARGKLVATRGYNDGDGGGDVMVDLATLDSASSMVAKFANPMWREVPVLTWRSLINFSRTPSLFLVRVGCILGTGFLIATVYWGLDHSPLGVQERIGFFALAMSATYYACADALPVFIMERNIFMRETAHNAYRKSSYVLAHALIYIPVLGTMALAFSISVWWAVGLAGGSAGFGFFVLITWASFWAGNSFVTLLSALMPNVMIGYMLVMAWLAYFLLLSGYFVTTDRIPKYWIWFHYMSPIKYPFDAVLINEFDRDGSCFQRGSEILFGTPLAEVQGAGLIDGMLGYLRGALANTSYAQLSPETCVLTGHDILVSRGIVLFSKWVNLGITISFGMFYRTLFYIVLRMSGKNRRH
ncbi:ATP-binding cassette, subfamily G (WHITE), member 2 [Marchantia polymorpha subsp. ruderalis]